MISGKKYNVILAVALAAALCFTLCFTYLPSLTGIQAASARPDYVEKLFGSDLIAIDIIADETEWQAMLDNALAEEYIRCDVLVNGERFTSVGVRPKGNTSLTSVAISDSDRYSFKLEFDHYISGQTCFGLDKFVVNNIQSDATYMKEYLAYQLMDFMDVPASLCSFANLSVNGETFGLYLAIEAVEESYAARHFGTDYGQLYKPESQRNQMGGQREENGAADRLPGGQADGAADGQTDTTSGSAQPSLGGNPLGQDNTAPDKAAGGNGDRMQPPNGMGGGPFGGRGGMGRTDGNTPLPDGQTDQAPDNAPDIGQGNPGGGTQSPFGGTPGSPSDGDTPDNTADGGAPDLPESAPFGGGQDGVPGGFGGGMPDGGTGGGSDLVYTDDDPESYSDIFEGAVFDPGTADYQRVITALEKLNAGEELETYIDVDEALRYFAVNTLLVNLDSYVGSLKHNYYLYEEDGRLSILPWDFNLAFAGFQGGSAAAAVNFPIDTPVSGTTLEDRPLLGKLLEVPEYKNLYHQYLQEIVTGYFDSGLFASTVQTIDALIGGLVEGDPTAFYSYAEYETARDTLLTFGRLRAQSIQGQLDGAIPSTSEGQLADSSALVDASSVNLSDMGTQGGGGMGGMDRDGGMGGRGGFVQGGENSSPDGTADPQTAPSAPSGAGEAEGQSDGSLPTLPKEDGAGTAQSPSAQPDGRQSEGNAGLLDGSQQTGRFPGQAQPAQDSPQASQDGGLPRLLITLAASLALPALGVGFMLLYLRAGRRNIC